MLLVAISSSHLWVSLSPRLAVQHEAVDDSGCAAVDGVVLHRPGVGSPLKRFSRKLHKSVKQNFRSRNRGDYIKGKDCK